jgi:hypothetical protein
MNTLAGLSPAIPDVVNCTKGCRKERRKLMAVHVLGI